MALFSLGGTKLDELQIRNIPTILALYSQDNTPTTNSVNETWIDN